MSDERLSTLATILRGASVAFLLGMAGYVLVFFFKLFAARVLGADQFGLYEMTYTFAALLGTVSALGLGQALLRYIPQYKQKREYRLLRGLKFYSLTLKLIISIALGAILYFSAPSITSFLNFESMFTETLRVISIAMPLITLRKHYSDLLLSEKRVFFAKVGHNIFEPLILLLGVLFVFLVSGNVLHLVWFLAGALAFNTLFGFVSYRLTSFKVPTKKIKITKSWLYFSLPLLFTGMLGFVLRWADNFIISYYLSAADVGIYAIAFSLSYYVVFFASLMVTIIMPILSELKAKSYTEMIDIFYRVKTWVFLASGFFALVFVVFSSEVLSVLFGSEFVRGSTSMSIMSLLFLCSVYFYFYQTLLMTNDDTKKILYNTGIFMTLNVVLNIVLVPVFGILGAAIASGSSYFLLRLGEMLFSRKYVTVGGGLQESKAIAIVLVNLGFLYFLKYLVSYLGVGLIGLIVILAVTYTAVYGLTLLLFKTFTQEDIRLMLAVEKRLGLDLGFLKRFVKKFL